MADSQLSIIERPIDDVMVLILTGQVLLDEGDLEFRRQIHDLIARGRVNVVVDLENVTYMDSSGAGMFAAKLKTLREAGGDMKLVRLTRRIQRLLGTMKLLALFEIFDDQEAAVRSFSSPTR